MANHVHAYRYVIFYLLSVFPSHLHLLNGQAKVRYCHNAVAMFCGVRESTYRPVWKRYIDDILCILTGTRSQLDSFLDRLNKAHPSIIEHLRHASRPKHPQGRDVLLDFKTYFKPIPMYIQTIGTRDIARHVASRRICPHIHILCMPASMPMPARSRSGSPHDDLHRSSYILHSRTCRYNV